MKERDEAWAKERHRRLWQWLSDNPSMEKKDWPGWKCEDNLWPTSLYGYLEPVCGGIGFKSAVHCYACAIAYIRYCTKDTYGREKCDYCPCDWGSDEWDSPIMCEHADALFDQWNNLYMLPGDYDETTLAQRSSFAAQIRDLWRD